MRIELGEVETVASEINQMKLRMMKNIYVTQPFLPPLEEMIPFMKRIWENRVLTNCGPFHQELESTLARYLGVTHISLFANATIGLITALQALRIKGEVITTPYSFVATSHSLLWNGIKPVFVDIDPDTFNLDPSKIEAAITPDTSAIMPVHCYGHPCDVHAIQRVADRYNLRVIYDAAHAFGVSDQDGSILQHGDLSILSFHATKVFNTFEGGAIVSGSSGLKRHIDDLKNFGIADEVAVVAPGINGKMSEFNAALGLLQLEYIDEVIACRKSIDQRYREGFAGVKGIRCHHVDKDAYTPNYAYFPVLVGPEYGISRDELYMKLKEHGVYCRRYFYPLISDYPMYRILPSSSHSNLPVAVEVAQQILCLPIYPGLDMSAVEKIIDLIRECSWQPGVLAAEAR
ncbi:putative transferase [Pelodictyon luteolum DSM 273]|uniref:Putative transferase n=2 Tax=Pelodictyon luteolum TaxID=1100 RepID=Q3B4U2_CHLL3|nr:DegT/DnrJ/EryC1/StrS family aminotransferase [Pelodictyon luteolum]ABB23639.1 putative transferase [Pelodictyon luteolum DSM 273]